MNKDVYKIQIVTWKYGLSAAKFFDGFSSGNVLMKNGMAGVGFISGLYRNSVDNTFNEQLSRSLSARIIESVLWQDLEKKEGDMSSYLGLLNGLSGVGLALVCNNYSIFPLSGSDSHFARVIH